MGSSASMGSVVIPSGGSGGTAPSTPAVVQNNGFIALGPLGGKFYLVKETDGTFRIVRADTLIKVSSETSVITPNANSAPGTKTTRTYSISIPRAVSTAGLVRFRLAVVEASFGASGSYRINLILKKNGVAVATLIGPTRVRNGVTFVFLETLVLPTTTFAAGDTFDITWEWEVVTSSAFSGAETIRTDPSVAGNEAIVEVDA